MIRTFALIFWGITASQATAQDDPLENLLAQWEEDRAIPIDGTVLDINALIWRARPVVIFADSPNDPAFRQQMDLLSAHADDLAERDVIIVVDTDPAAESELRTRLRPRGFSLVLIGKDGEVELRKPAPWSVREISRSIDKMPVRQQEVEDRRNDP